MCGGKGTRMWPISNISHPKQFENFLGKTSMFRQTIERVLLGFKPEDIFIATSTVFAKDLKTQAPEIPQDNFILEPAMRDNLGAIALATAIIHKRFPNAVMAILWGADHVVKKQALFISALKQAAKLAHDHDLIVHLDTPPSYPTVHNGWIEIGRPITKINSFQVFEFVRQIEKPNQLTAQKLFNSRKYLIHTGYMATKPSLLLDYYRRYAPETFAVLERIRPSIDTSSFNTILTREYPHFPKNSVDYGLFEKLPPKSQWELPVEMGWIDVGTWELLYHGLPKDKHNNVVIGSAYLIDVKNCLIIGRDKGKIGLIGLDSMIVVSTPSGLLVCPLNQAPKVKDLYNQIYDLSSN